KRERERERETVDVRDKLAYFQAITGLEDPDLCTEILATDGWDLEFAIASFTGNPSQQEPSSAAATSATATATLGDVVSSSGNQSQSNSDSHYALQRSESTSLVAAAPNLAWKLITLPISVISGSLGLVSGAIGLGMWAVGGVLSYSLGMLGLGSGRVVDSSATSPLISSVSAAATEAMEFVAAFESEYGGLRTRPNFAAKGFMDALQRSRHAYTGVS
ncbi:hypothetical protein Ancab_015501, partial [Ancistrocladus abbreviatus]